MSKIPVPAIPHFDAWRLNQEFRETTSAVNMLTKSLPEFAASVVKEIDLIEERLAVMEKAQERLQLLLSAIQRDLPSITKNCPNVLAVAANIAIEDGGLDKP